MASLRRVATPDLDEDELADLRLLLDEAFAGDFGDTDWASSLGGTHVLVEEGRIVVAHASVVPRTLRLGDREVRAGYVEAVATRPGHQRRGLGRRALEEAGRVIADDYEIGALSTGLPGFYELLGWQLWRGPTFASTPDGIVRTTDDDGGIMVLRTPTTGTLDLDAPITCDWRQGDVW